MMDRTKQMEFLIDSCIGVFPVKMTCPNCSMTFEFELDEFIQLAYNKVGTFCHRCTTIKSSDSTLVDAIQSIEDVKRDIFKSEEEEKEAVLKMEKVKKEKVFTMLDWLRKNPDVHVQLTNDVQMKLLRMRMRKGDFVKTHVLTWNLLDSMIDDAKMAVIVETLDYMRYSIYYTETEAV